MLIMPGAVAEPMRAMLIHELVMAIRISQIIVGQRLGILKGEIFQPILLVAGEEVAILIMPEMEMH